VLDDPELNLAYPQLRSVEAYSDPFAASSGAWAAGGHGPGSPARIALGRYDDYQEGRNAALHEIDHIVAIIEDFPRGGGPDDFKPGGRLAHFRRAGESEHEAYLRVAGEWLAWRAGDRQWLTPAERRAQPLRPPDDLIVHYSDNLPFDQFRHIPPHIERQVRKLTEAGLSAALIAERMGTTPRQVASWRNILGIRASSMPRHTQHTERLERLTPEELAAGEENRLRQRERVTRQRTAREEEERRVYQLNAEPIEDEAAVRLRRQLIAIENRLRGAGKSPTEIAREINLRFQEGVTSGEVASGNVWWRE
jgi:hypothetical protein